MNNPNQVIKLRCINNSRSNVISRVSKLFRKKLDLINDQRIKYNLNELSKPKLTELIVRHKLWSKIEQDLINFLLDEEDEEE